MVANEVTRMGTGSLVKVIQTDVTNRTQVEEMVEESVAEFGSVDVLVNNVGWTVDRLFLEKPREEHEKEVAVNLWSPHQLHPCSPATHDRTAGRFHSQH